MKRRNFIGMLAAAPLAAVVSAVQAKPNVIAWPAGGVAPKLALDLIGAKTEYRWRHDMVEAPWMAVTTVNISGERYDYATLHTSLEHAEANHQRAALAAIRKFVHAPGL